MIDDLNSLIKELQPHFDGKVNQGPQKWRGQSDSLSHTINSIDSYFRKSLNRHNQYHVNVGNIPRGSFIGRSKFFYQNNLNLGNVRWYSTAKYTKYIMKDNRIIYSEIAEYIKDLSINKETQLKIETSLLKMASKIFITIW